MTKKNIQTSPVIAFSFLGRFKVNVNTPSSLVISIPFTVSDTSVPDSVESLSAADDDEPIK